MYIEGVNRIVNNSPGKGYHKNCKNGKSVKIHYHQLKKAV